MADVYLNILATIDKVQADVKGLQNQMTQLQAKSEDVNETMREGFDKSAKSAGALKGMLGTIFSVAAITAFISKMILMRTEWEKQEQVLKTLTGSQIEAANAMKMLKGISESTTADIRDVTDGYKRLISQGIKPTEEQMRRLVDVATAANRSFTQLAEAIFGAANKNNKAMREFGVQTKMVGDKVQLTYRNITKEVDFTAQAIADFMIELGGTQGIMGAGAEAAGTLATSVSNLKESWQSLILEMGEGSSGVIKGVLDFFNDVLGGIEEIQKIKRGTETSSKGLAQSLVMDLVGSPEDIAFIENEITGLLDKIKGLQTDLDVQGENISKRKKKRTEEEIQDINNTIFYLNEWITANKKIEDVVDVLGLIEEKQNKLKQLKDDLIGATTIEQQEKIKDQIVEIEAALKKMLETDVDRAKEKKKLDEEEERRQEKRANELEKELNRQEGIYDKFYSWLESEANDTWNDIKAIEESHWKAANYIIEKMYLEREVTDKEYLENKRQIAIEQAKIVGKDEIKTQREIDAEIDLINAEYDQKAKERKERIAEEIFTRSISFLNTYSQYQNAKMDAELAKVEGNEKKQEEIRKKYARKEQVLSIARAIISGAEGILKTGANLGYPLAIPFQVVQAIETAMQIATIKAQKFATGVLDLQGRGTGTSDSIPSMLSRGESVMTAKETKDFYPYLKAMKEGNFPRLQLELMNDFAKLQGTTNNLNYDNSKEIRELREIRKALNRDYSETTEGKYKVIRRGGITTKISLN